MSTKKGRRVNKASNVIDLGSSKPSSFVGKERERKVVKKRHIETREGEQ